MWRSRSRWVEATPHPRTTAHLNFRTSLLNFTRGILCGSSTSSVAGDGRLGWHKGRLLYSASRGWAFLQGFPSPVPLPLPRFLFGFFSDGCEGGSRQTIDVHRASLKERVRLDRLAQTSYAHTRGGSEGMEEDRHSADANPGSPLSLLFP